MEKAVAKQAVMAGIQMDRLNRRSPEEMGLNQREAIQKRGDGVVPLNVPAEASPISDDAQRQEAIQRAAWELFRNRTALTGSEETEPSNFDLRAAKVAYDAVRKQDEAEKPFYPPVVVSDFERERSVVPVKQPDVHTAEPMPGEPQQKALEGTPEKTIEELKVDLEAKRLVYAQLDLDKSRKWIKLKNLLGAGIKEVPDEDYDRAWGEYEEARMKYFEAKRADVLTKGDKEGAKEFLREFEGADEAIKLLNLKYDLKKEQSGYPAKALYGFEKLANGWKEMSFKKKLAVSAAIFGVGALAGLTGGASFGLIGATAFTLRTAQRTLGAGAMYIGAKQLQDKWSSGRMEKELKYKVDVFLESNRWLEKIKNLEYGQLGEKTKYSKEQIEALDKKHKRMAFALAAAIGIGGTAFDMYRQGFFGGKGGKIIEEAANRPAAGAYPEEKSGLVGYGTEASGHDLVDAHPEGKYGPGFSGSETEGHDVVDAYPEGKYGTIGHGTEAEGHIPETKTGGAMEELAKSPAAGAEVHTPEIAKTQFEEIAAVKIKAGGSMWGSIENNIKANPSAYRLDPKDPHFTKDMHQMTQQMLDEFASRKGMSYEQLDQIARGKIRAGDTFKIIHDPSTRDIYIDDFHGKAFGPDVSQAASVEEIASSKPKLAVEDLKPRTGVPDHQPARGAGRIAGMEEIDARQHAAQAKYANAVQAEQEWHRVRPQIAAENARDLAIANHQLYVANRGLLGDVFHKIGISKYYNIFDQSMAKWNDLIGTEPRIAQDVLQADVINASNESWDKLNDLHRILEYYNTSGHETIGECLRRALADPKIGPFGRGESIGAQVQQAINEILNNKK